MNEEPNIEKDIFSEALELPAGQREGFLKGACRGDEELRQRVEDLLRVHGEASGILETNATLPAFSEVTLMEEKEGERIGRYKLLQKIGHGGCGVVYMAEQQEPVYRSVALKVIKLGMDTRQVVARFKAEQQALALMDHPNIAKVLDAGATETGRPYFVMELVRGIRITDYCDQNNLTTQDRLKLFIQVCLAVQHAHQKGIVHRDLKPSNILVTLHDGVPVPKVIDFGIAKATQGRLIDQTLFTAFEQFVGTPAYMSPEQAEMSGLDVDTRSDIYSLGVLLYELLVGTTPFATEELMAAGLDAMRRTIREKEPVRPSTRLSTMLAGTLAATAHRRQIDAPKLIHLVRGDLDWVVMKCLEKDRTRRYETANGLAADIKRHLNNEPVVARPPSTAYRFQKAFRRNKSAFVASFAVAVALVAGIAVSTWQAVHAIKSRDQAAASERRALKAQADEALQRQRAESSGEKLRKNLYVADIGLAFQAWELGNAGRARELLEQQRPADGHADLRTFEWRYLYGITRAQELFTLESRSKEVWGTALSRNGRILATGGEEGGVQLWDLLTRKELANLKVGSKVIYSLAFSPDGERLVVPSNDGVSPIHVLNVETGEIQGLLRGHSGGVPWVSYSPDGKSIASVCSWIYATNSPGEIWIWDAASLEKRAQLSGHRASVGLPAFSPDSSTLATPMGDGTILLWNLQSGQVERTFAGHRGLVFAAAFSPDGKWIASAGIDHTVRLWEKATGRMSALLGTHAGAVFSVAFSPDGMQIASGSIDHTAKFWSLQDGQELATFKGHTGRILSLSFSPDGHELVTGSLDGTVKAWPVPLQSGSSIFDRHDGTFASVSFSADGRWLLRNAPNQVRLWNAATRTKVATVDGEGAVSPDGQRLVCVRSSGVDVWDLSGAAPSLVRTIPAQDKLSRQPRFSPDGMLLALHTEDHSIVFWRTDGWGEAKRIKEGNRDTIADYAFSPDGRLFATSSDSGAIRLWNTGNWSAGRVLTLPPQDLHGLEFSPDGRWLAVGCRDTAVRLWDIAAGDVYELRGGAGSVWSLAFTRDGKTLAIGSHEGLVKFWNVSTRREVATLNAHPTVVSGLAFSRDDTVLATIGVDQTMRLWTAPGLEETDRQTPAAARR